MLCEDDPTHSRKEMVREVVVAVQPVSVMVQEAQLWRSARPVSAESGSIGSIDAATGRKSISRSSSSSSSKSPKKGRARRMRCRKPSNDAGSTVRVSMTVTVRVKRIVCRGGQAARLSKFAAFAVPTSAAKARMSAKRAILGVGFGRSPAARIADRRSAAAARPPEVFVRFRIVKIGAVWFVADNSFSPQLTSKLGEPAARVFSLS